MASGKKGYREKFKEKFQSWTKESKRSGNPSRNNAKQQNEKRGRRPNSPPGGEESGGPLDPRRHPLVLVLAAVSLGITVDHVLGTLAPPVAWWLIAVIPWLAWRVRSVYRASRLSLALLLVSLVGVGGTWHQLRWNWFPADHLGLLVRDGRQPVCLEGIVLSGPRRHPAADDPWGPPRDAGSRMLLRVLRVRQSADWQAASGLGTLRVRGTIETVQAGDTVRVYGNVRAPGRPANPGDFDYARRLRMERELFLLDSSHPACVVKLRDAPWWSPRRHLEMLRRQGRATLAEHLPEREAQLAGALLLGARELLADEDVLPFFLTGTVHLLAISGLHLGILVAGIWLFARLGWISRHAAICASLLLVVPYALVTECRPPVVRAAVFVVVVCGGRWLSRPVVGWNTMAAAGLFLLALNPLHLFQTGVHLSFLALCGLALAVKLFPAPSDDPLDRLIASTRPWPQRTARRGLLVVTRMIVASLAVWLLTVPLVASHFHVVSLAGILLNPLLWIPLAGALFSGFLLLLGGWLFPSAWWYIPGRCLGSICSGSLGGLEWLIHRAAGWRFSHFWTAAPPGWWVTGFYLLLALWICRPTGRPPRRAAILFAVTWLVLGMVLMVGPRLRGAPNQLVCTFFSVGHGTCVLIESPDGQFLLYDAGHLGPPQSVVRVLSRYLWSARTNRLRKVVISHADMDHFNAVPGLAERFRIEQVWVPPHVVRHRSPLVLRLRDHLQKLSVDLHVVHRGATLQSSSGWELHILHPPASMRSGSDNAQSLVVWLSYAGRTILLPGDLESPGLEMLLRDPPRAVDVVMAPHHGSARSDPRAFVAWSNPRWVIVSSGRPLSASVAESFRHAGAELWETSRDGAVRVEVKQDGTLRVLGWKRHGW